MAGLAHLNLKHGAVVDDDIDGFDPLTVESAIARRVQADLNVVIVVGARAKPHYPSLSSLPYAGVPTTAKKGIDATIPNAVPCAWFERIAYVGVMEVHLVVSA